MDNIDQNKQMMEFFCGLKKRRKNTTDLYLYTDSSGFPPPISYIEAQ
jgi:hypothetical protein